MQIATWIQKEIVHVRLNRWKVGNYQWSCPILKCWWVKTWNPLFDFWNAFVKVSHNCLLYKLTYYGINEDLHSWIKDSLTNRHQEVILKLIIFTLIHVSPIWSPSGFGFVSIVYQWSVKENLTHKAIHWWCNNLHICM